MDKLLPHLSHANNNNNSKPTMRVLLIAFNLPKNYDHYQIFLNRTHSLVNSMIS